MPMLRAGIVLPEEGVAGAAGAAGVAGDVAPAAGASATSDGNPAGDETPPGPKRAAAS
jgi:hypothetical protein